MDKAIVDRLRSAYREWSDSKGGSIDTWMALMADEIAFHSLAEGAQGMEFSAPCHCHDEVRGYFARLLEDWEMLSFEMDKFVADDDTVVAIGRCAFKNRHTGKTSATPKVDIWTFKDGKAVGVMEFYDTADAFAAATPG